MGKNVEFWQRRIVSVGIIQNLMYLLLPWAGSSFTVLSYQSDMLGSGQTLLDLLEPFRLVFHDTFIAPCRCAISTPIVVDLHLRSSP